MKNDRAREIIEEIADDCGEKVEPYSGRMMYGKECCSITTDTPEQIEHRASELRVSGARRDNMGHSYVVYWPFLPYKERE